jgi:Ca-activated chloride channel family protein
MPGGLVRIVRRLFAISFIVVAASTLAALTPTPVTGKLEGRVRDQAGAPIANAQVTIVGTALGALTNNTGYYLFNSVPAGAVTIRVAFVGYKTVEVQGIKVWTGRTVTQDVVMEQTSVQLDAFTVVSAAEPLVPRDEVTSTQRITGGHTSALPTDGIGAVLPLQPGVVATPGGAASIRGGRTDQSTAYVNGVPVTPGYRGSGFGSTNGFDQAAVTTGAASAEFGNAQSGIVNIEGNYANNPEAYRYPHYDPRSGERYAWIRDNGFLGARDNPLSTFSIDVDAASYSNMRRFLSMGQSPPPEAVRIEELINYFDYDYRAPRAGQPFSVATEMMAAPWNPQHRLVLVGLKGRTLEGRELPPSNLVFLIDVSGSMADPNKLPLVQSAFRLLVPQLRERDRVAIVVYAGSAGLVLPSTAGSERETILQAIDQLTAGGSTAGGAGIQLAYRIAKENFIQGGNNRVILATDGDFNVGVSSDAELVRLIEEKRREGTFLTVLGFGTGNLQDAKMEQLADKGNGQYAYIDNLNEARKVFVQEMRSTLFTIAKDVKIQVEFNPALVSSYRLIGYENRILAAQDFNDDIKDAGELGAGHSVTALYEIVPPGAGVDGLRYQTSPIPPAEHHTDELLTVKLRYKEPDGETSRLITHVLRAGGAEASDNIRFASAVAGFGLILRNSEHRGNATPEMVVRLAREASGEDEFGYREEFIRLVESYRQVRTTALSGGGL